MLCAHTIIILHVMNKMFIEAKCFVNPSMSNIGKIINIFLDKINKNTVRFAEMTQLVN